MKFILAIVVLVGMATKMTEACCFAETCCFPDQVKADVFFIMNLTMTTPNKNLNMEISGIGNFAFDFKAQKFAFLFGRVGTSEETLISGAAFLVDFPAETVTMSIIGGDDKYEQCVSKKIKGKLTDKHQCMIENSGMMKVMSAPEMTIYAMTDEDTQVALVVDANCMPKLLQSETTLPGYKGYFDRKISVDGIELQVEDADFAPPCDNPLMAPGPPMKVTPPEESVMMIFSSMFAKEAIKRRR
ncbi:uncharacterized protein LOC135492164 [Lineus longissimus]|uniref:uncharacterized protein LOC135492164 n=1 Tax=Lineus longissimus TaxID=88925 RepID=UPI00315CF0EE